MNAGQFVSRLTRKSRSNFFYAFLCLPRAQREAIYACYAFCRIVDDAVDLGQDRTAPRAALEEIIAGVEMDLDHPTYETWDALYPYCYRVASAVGLCCIEIFGYSDPRAREYAVNLGIALQLTNILRDVQVDARAGRTYLPQADLRRFGVTAEDLAQGHYTPQFVQLMAFEAGRAREYYQRAWTALPPVDTRRLFAAEIMGRTYFALLRAIEARRFDVFSGRVTLPTARRVAIALRCWLASCWS